MTKQQEKLIENFIRIQVRKELNEARPSIIAAKKFPKISLTVKPNVITINQVSDDTNNSISMTIQQFNLMLQKYQAAMK